MKKKQWILVGSIFLVLFLGSIWFYYKQQHTKKVQQHYATYVVTTKEITLYKKVKNKYSAIGTIASGVSFPLEEIEELSSLSEKFQIKGEPYYVSYHDVKPTTPYQEAILKEYYLPFSDQVKTQSSTKLYQNGKLVIMMEEERQFQIQYQDLEFYYIFYQGQVFGIRKDESLLLPSEEKVPEVEQITVLNYAPIQKECTLNTCISEKKVQEQLQFLKEQKVSFLSLAEYQAWQKGYIKLQGNVVLLVTSEKFDRTFLEQEDSLPLELLKDTKISFLQNDQPAKRGEGISSSYVVHQTTSLKRYQRMLQKEVLTEPIIAQKLPLLEEKATAIPVLNYHFFYDPSKGEVCNETICLAVADFREQLQFFVDHQYKTLTIEEFRAWMYGEIELPARSVLLTIDDGAMGTGKQNGNKLIPLLEELDLHATLFLITGWWDIENYRSSNLDVQSHTNDMHTGNLCKDQFRGAQMLCSSQAKVKTDLEQSIAILGSRTAFCFPFYASNSSAIQTVKEVGFQLAFVGGNHKATRKSNFFQIPRYPIYKTTTLNQLIAMISS